MTTNSITAPIHYRIIAAKNVISGTHTKVAPNLLWKPNHQIAFLFWMSKFLVITISLQPQCIENLHFPALVLVFFTFIPFMFKLNSIKSLVFRSYSICSDYFLLLSGFQFLNNYFVSNGFPSGLVHSVIRHFLDHKFTNGINNNANDRPVQYFSLPYFGSQSEKLKIELSKLFSKYVPNVDLKVILVNNFKLGSFFRYKDRLPCGSRS